MRWGMNDHTRPLARQEGQCDGTDCWAHLDWHCEHAGLVRVFGGGDEYRRDPYCYALAFRVVDRFDSDDKRRHGLIEFEGVFVCPRACQYRAIRTAARAAGWGVVRTRVNGGVARTNEICRAAWRKSATAAGGEEDSCEGE